MLAVADLASGNQSTNSGEVGILWSIIVRNWTLRITTLYRSIFTINFICSKLLCSRCKKGAVRRTLRTGGAGARRRRRKYHDSAARAPPRIKPNIVC